MTLPRHPYQSSIHPGRCGAAGWLSAGHQRLCGLSADHLAHVVDPAKYEAAKALRNAKPQANTYVIGTIREPMAYWDGKGHCWDDDREMATVYSEEDRFRFIEARGSSCLPRGGCWVPVEPQKAAECPVCASPGIVRDLVAVREAIPGVIEKGCTLHGGGNGNWLFSDKDGDREFVTAERRAFCDAVVQAITEAAK